MIDVDRFDVPILATVCKDYSSFDTVCELDIVAVVPKLVIVPMLTVNSRASSLRLGLIIFLVA